MKLLLDMNISLEWVTPFRAAGFDCFHWSEIGNIRAEDSEIFNWAVQNGFIVLTHDLDFGAILAATNANAPSVIQIRMSHWLPSDADVERTLRYLQDYIKELNEGALITIDENRLRVRILPISK